MTSREWFLYILSWVMIFYIQILYKKFVIPSIEKEKNIVYLSASDNIGFDTLINAITKKIEENIDTQDNFIMITKRVRDLLNDAVYWLKTSISNTSIDFDILSEQIKYASNSLGKATGIITVDETMDLMFSSLCLGK